jgi:hypothetical protein
MLSKLRTRFRALLRKSEIEGRAIYPMKRYAHEALLKHIFAFDIRLDGSVGKCQCRADTRRHPPRLH